MQIEELLTVVLDPNLGTPWPDTIGKRPSWVLGQKWRVEYTFSSPAVTLSALALGNDVRGVWRYEVIADEQDSDGNDIFTLRISPERRGSAGYHFIAQYRKQDLLLLRARRYEGDIERPFELRRLPGLDQEVKKLGDGRTWERKFTMKAPPTSALAPSSDEDAFAGAEATEEGG